jgi:hypothetical protein
MLNVGAIGTHFLSHAIRPAHSFAAIRASYLIVLQHGGLPERAVIC